MPCLRSTSRVLCFALFTRKISVQDPAATEHTGTGDWLRSSLSLSALSRDRSEVVGAVYIHQFPDSITRRREFLLLVDLVQRVNYMCGYMWRLRDWPCTFAITNVCNLMIRLHNSEMKKATSSSTMLSLDTIADWQVARIDIETRSTNWSIIPFLGLVICVRCG